MRDELYNYAEGLQGVGTVPPYVAQQWLSFLREGKTVTVSLSGGNNTAVRLEQLENNVSGGYMGDLSSWGPTWELAMNPQIAAPGANILSTFPMAMGGYRVMTGTSMCKYQSVHAVEQSLVNGSSCTSRRGHLRPDWGGPRNLETRALETAHYVDGKATRLV